MNDFPNAEANDDGPGDLEISDLPPSERSHYTLIKLTALFQRLRTFFTPTEHVSGNTGPRQTRRQRHIKIGQALTALGLCAALLLLFVGNAPGLRARFLGFFDPPIPTPTPTFTGYFTPPQGNVPIVVRRRKSLPTIGNQGPLGPLPGACPQANMLQFFLTTLDPPGLGGGPLWFTGFVGPTAALVDLQPLGTSLSHPPGSIIGWYEGLAVFIQKGFPGTIVLQGKSQSADSSLLFASSGSLNFAPSLTLSAQNFSAQPALNGSWEMTSINILVPESGCYELLATWSDHSTWLRYFAAGK